jgi:hypothetical protein
LEIEGKAAKFKIMKLAHSSFCCLFYGFFPSTKHAYGRVESVLVLRRQNASERRERCAPERVDPVVAAAVS